MMEDAHDDKPLGFYCRRRERRDGVAVATAVEAAPAIATTDAGSAIGGCRWIGAAMVAAYLDVTAAVTSSCINF